MGGILLQLLRSRLALGGSLAGVAVLASAAFVRLIPWWLFFVTVFGAMGGVAAFARLRQWWGARKDASLEGGMDAQSQRQIGRHKVRDREAVKSLHAQWKASVETLRKSKVGRQRRPLYFLPWYAIIGSPKAGKTTAILNSGLHFPMGEPKLQGTGGTRNCDWFFAEEAIILDTAGRYSSAEEAGPDADEWREFLKLLRKYRARVPINGLIVAVSAASFDPQDIGLMSNELDEVLQHARNLRKKLDEIVAELGIQFPVYLLITKADLIEGFTDFFGRLPKKKLDEMLGWTNPSWDPSEPKKLLADAFAELDERVRSLRTHFLWEEERAESLRKVYLFPEELRAFWERLEAFADVLLKETRYNESPFLRGIYLTSGIQKGTALSAMIRRLGLAGHASELPEEKKSYFLKDLFGQRLSADRNLVAISGQAGGRLQVVNNLGFAVVAALAIAFAGATGGSYIANRTLLLDVEDEMRAAVASEKEPPDEQLAALGRYVDALERLEDRNQRRPLSAGWGLYQGYKVMEPARRLFLERFARDAYDGAHAGALQAVEKREPERGFVGLEALIRNYVLSKELNHTRAEAPGPNLALLSFWPGAAGLDDDGRATFTRGYDAFLRWREAAAADLEQRADLAIVQRALPEMLTVERVTAWADRSHQPFRAQDLKLPAAVAKGGQVRGAFTPAAWTQQIGPLCRAVELVASDVDPGVVDRFRAQYAGRYFDEWLQFLLRTGEASDGAIPLAQELSDKSPYLALVDRVATATTAPAELAERTRPAWAVTVGRVHEGRAGYVGQLDAMARHLNGADEDPEAALQNAKDIFGSTRRLQPAAVDDGGALDPFGKTERWVETALADPPPADADDAKVRMRLSALLRAPVYDAFGAFLRTVAKEVNVLWRDKVVDRCGAQGVTPQCYGGSNGIVWAFYNEVLDPFYERRSYQPKVRYTKSMPLTPELPRFLRKAAEVVPPDGRCRSQVLLFETVPSADPGEGGMRVTRTTFCVQCKDDVHPWCLEHRQFRATRQLRWIPEDCTEAELKVFVGTGPEEEHALKPLGAPDLPQLLRQATRQGKEFSWTFPDNVTVTYAISPADALLTCTMLGQDMPKDLIAQ